jgi:hypothetical protein
MTAAPVAILDALASLLDAEVNSLFRFLGDGSPYLSDATADVRKPLADMVAASHRRATELASLIDQLGGVPRAVSHPGEEVYLAYLSLKFLLPKLVNEKRLEVERYENDLSRITDMPDEVRSVLTRHLDELRADQHVLEEASARVNKRQAS